MKSNRRATMQIALVSLSLVSLSAGAVRAEAAAADPTAWRLKTPAPSAARFQAFLDAASSLRTDLDKSKGLPADAAARLARVKSLSGGFLQASEALASSLRQNGESAAFDELIAARLKRGGHSVALSEIQRLGGPFKLVAETRKQVDEDLSDLTTRIDLLSSKASLPVELIESVVGGLIQLLEADPAWAVYGGGVQGTCTWYHILYMATIGVEPRYCVY